MLIAGGGCWWQVGLGVLVRVQALVRVAVRVAVRVQALVRVLINPIILLLMSARGGAA